MSSDPDKPDPGKVVVGPDPDKALWSAKHGLEAILGLPYIHQRDYGYSCCSPISYLNAAIFYKVPEVPEPPSLAWEILVDACGCRHGSAISEGWLLTRYKLDLFPLFLDKVVVYSTLRERIPIVLSIFSKVGFHATLAVAAEYAAEEDDDFDLWLVNADGAAGDLIQKVTWSQIEMPCRENPQRWNVPLAVVHKRAQASFMPPEPLSS